MILKTSFERKKNKTEAISAQKMAHAGNIALPLFGQDQHSSKHFISTDHLLFWGLTSFYSQTSAMQNVGGNAYDRPAFNRKV
jgi:hypothetical protein